MRCFKTILFSVILFCPFFIKGQIISEIRNEKSYTDSLTILINEGIALIKSDNLSMATDIFRSIIKRCEIDQSRECQLALINANNEMSTIYSKREIFEHAFRFSNEAIEKAELFGDPLTLAHTHLNRGNLYYNTVESHTDSNNNIKKADVSKYKIDALQEYIEGLDIIKEIGGDAREELPLFYYSIAQSYIQDENYNKAEEYLLTTLTNLEQYPNVNIQNKSKLALAFVYKEFGEYEKTLILANSIKDDENIGVKTDIYYTLSKAYEGLGKYDKAYQNLNLAFDEQGRQKYDSKRKELIDVEAKYNNERLTNEKIFLEKEQLKAKTQQERTKFINVILLSGTLLVFGISAFVFMRNRYKNQYLQLQLLKHQQETEIQAINAMIDGKETERENIGRFLHDQVSALLNSANIHLEVLASELPKDYSILAKTQSMLDDVADQVRTLSHHLLSDLLVKFGLTVALDDICERMSNNKLRFDFSTSIVANKRYNKQIENKLYSITQELCNNILKHSNANKASITLNEKDNNLILIVADNGKGFDDEDMAKGGAGLYQVRTRITSMGGSFKIYHGATTKIEIFLPCDTKSESKTQKRKFETT